MKSSLPSTLPSKQTHTRERDLSGLIWVQKQKCWSSWALEFPPSNFARACFSWRLRTPRRLGVAQESPKIVVDLGKFVKAGFSPPQGKRSIRIPEECFVQHRWGLGLKKTRAQVLPSLLNGDVGSPQGFELRDQLFVSSLGYFVSSLYFIANLILYCVILLLLSII